MNMMDHSTRPPRLSGAVIPRNPWAGLGTLVLAWILLTVTPAVALSTAQEYIDHGYDLLAQARRTLSEDQHEHLLSAAITSFSKAYQYIGQRSKVHALIGAAQGYLLMRKTPAVFPFLWSASPLQRAEKSLQQALVLQPDSSAAALLMGMTLWRQAATAASQHTEFYQRSMTYVRHAAALGIPVHVPATPTEQSEPLLPPLHIDAPVLLVRYVDARGTGYMDDLLLAYRTSEAKPHCYGIVVSAGIAYPLTTALVNDTMALGDHLDDLKVRPGPHARPMVVAVMQHDGRQVEARFVWDGGHFVLMGVCPVDS